MTTLKKNIFMDVDSYKYSHFLQYPEPITNISSYIEARSAWEGVELPFFGLQMWILDNIQNYKVSMDDIIEAEITANAHGLPFNRDDALHMVGKPLPLFIQAVKEGTLMQPSNVMLQVTNTGGQRTRWLTSFVETSLLRAIWYPVTVATMSREIKKIIKQYLDETGDPSLLPFKLDDFGFRGVSSYESGCIGGLAHLVNFMGSDTIGALQYGKKFYDEPMAGFSIPAAEHSTITAWGRNGESMAYRNMINKFGGPNKLYAVVSDSYDIYNAVEEIWGRQLQDKVREKGGTLVVRPDSGDPTHVVLGVVERLGDRFGYKYNSKDYKVLDPCVRVIQGDGINSAAVGSILSNLKSHGWSADNVAFGMGGALLQQVNRDTFSFAMKASAISTDDAKTWEPIKKDPKTSALKKSKAGRLMLVLNEDGQMKTVPEGTGYIASENLLEPVWKDGELLRKQTFADIRQRAAVVI